MEPESVQRSGGGDGAAERPRHEVSQEKRYLRMKIKVYAGVSCSGGDINSHQQTHIHSDS